MSSPSPRQARVELILFRNNAILVGTKLLVRIRGGLIKKHVYGMHFSTILLIFCGFFSKNAPSIRRSIRHEYRRELFAVFAVFATIRGIRGIREYQALLFALFVFAANIKITIRDTSNFQSIFQIRTRSHGSKILDPDQTF